MTTTTSTTATDTCLHNIHDHRLITIINTMTSITTPATTIINITITIRRHGHFDLWHRSMTIATTINTTICHHELPSGPTHTTTKPCGHHSDFPSQVLLDAGADAAARNGSQSPLLNAILGDPNGDCRGHLPVVQALLSRRPALANAVVAGGTPLFAAAEHDGARGLGPPRRLARPEGLARAVPPWVVDAADSATPAEPHGAHGEAATDSIPLHA